MGMKARTQAAEKTVARLRRELRHRKDRPARRKKNNMSNVAEDSNKTTLRDDFKTQCLMDSASPVGVGICKRAKAKHKDVQDGEERVEAHPIDASLGAELPAVKLR